MPGWDVVAYNGVIACYGVNGHIEAAMSVFDSMPERSVLSWNAAMAAFSQLGKQSLGSVRDLFHAAPEKTIVTYNSLLQACAAALEIEHTKNLFDKMPEWDIVSWNILLAAFAENKQLDLVKDCFRRMPESDIVSWYLMLTTLAQSDRVEECKEFFDKMPEWHLGSPDVVSCNAMIAGFVENGHFVQAEMMYGSMSQRDRVTHNTMIALYARNGDMPTARRIFDGMPERDMACWAGVISGYAQAGHPRDAIDLFRAMEMEGLAPNEFLFTDILSACNHTGLVRESWRYFALMAREHAIPPSIQHFCLMIDALGRSGRLDEAQDVIQAMPFFPDGVALNTYLGSCKIHHDSQGAASIARQAIIGGRLAGKNVEETIAAPHVLLSNIYMAIK
ncbi:hypothetical protein SELMODRAFT_98793 [Selaginella moellendorffii]|uniref:Pentacotripeptide-repeat region of PRORP domain-containing protein n=1 Tax=Selaginella moellendorffii TaxID=88036 RepID=D8RQD7_SELML|nr:hypothetical protein SELMODRAFT_98793 [Selaginella moellendorffii]